MAAYFRAAVAGIFDGELVVSSITVCENDWKVVQIVHGARGATMA